MSAFDIKLEGYDKLMDALKNRPKEIIEEVDDAFKATGYEIMTAAKDRAPNDRGTIANAISVDVNGVLHVEVACPVAYAPYQEFGTRGKVNIPSELSDIASQYKGATGGSFQELLQAILGWVRRNGISGTYSTSIAKSGSGKNAHYYQKGYWNGNQWVSTGQGRRLGSKKTQAKQDMEAAYPIALSIVKNGIPAQPFFFPGFFEAKPKLIERIKNILIK